MTTTNTLIQLLTTVGLSDNDITLYRALLTVPQATARELTQKTRLSRTMVYYVLGRLESDQLISATKTGSKTSYEVEPPEALENLLLRQEENLQRRKNTLAFMLPDVRSLYNIAHNKPGTRFFEGWDQVEKALFSTLPKNKEVKEIYAFVDLENMAHEIDLINKRYVAERRKRGINKKILVADSPHNRRYLSGQGSTLTEVRFLPKEIHSFHFGMEIHDDTISYISVRKEGPIAVSIHDPYIYNMHRELFLSLWKTLAKS